MSWLVLAAIAQFLNAIVAILDKYIVTDEKLLPKPFVYAFYSCLFAGVWLLVYLIGLIPFNISGIPSYAHIERPTLAVVALSFLAAYTFFIGLVSLYSALKKADASDVMPVVGAVAAVASFGLAYELLNQRLSPNFMYGIALLAIGTFLVSRYRFSKSIALSAVHAGIFFALNFIAMKGLFNITSFDNGFFWSRIALVIFALTLLLVPGYYELIHSGTKAATKKAGVLIMGNKVIAGVAGIMLLKAASLGEVTVVQSLDGLKFVFILLIAIVIGQKMPSACREVSCRRREVIQKALFVGVISLGFVILFI
ncbi:hypothetical protein GW943_00915 [Candidatus Parcubacteria bacterium]|uniref:EamA domain-containing protein n=1 Tax=Candidatus Kaiserbacteria bacterium CG10_big_fil_rev_8_21_14_0_10_47_16 TaxID=1974608 RepID=A0A2H0UFE6_9BACT|nr:hypothetical protein [Candidatus Parcubacteria bacterium]PIR84396.1 MAG: hypothetical protein COU16_02295 [Candidatus Kaiserbacteria bacterium CG10_big_fil_rev_8_21_14_0_10_47_16]